MKPLTDLELEIMQVVWDLRKGTVRDVYEVLRDRRRIAYTTVMTMMNILEQKGHLRRKKAGRAFEYTPTVSRQKALSSMVDDFVGRVFDGSAMRLVLGLAKERKLSPEDLKAVERLLEEET